MNNREFAPVAVFGYNRLDKLKKCIECLAENEEAKESDLYIFVDGYKGEKDKDAVTTVQEWALQYKSGDFKSIHVTVQPHNIGLANSIVGGVTKVINEYGRAIVVEDDLSVSPSFLAYMNDGLDYYQDDTDIWSIASYGYNLRSLKNYKHDIYVSYRSSRWGWATWKDRWEQADWEMKGYNEIAGSKALQDKMNRGGGDLFPMLERQMQGLSDSWAVKWAYSAAMHDAMTIYPKVGLVKNFGFDGSGTHTGPRESHATFESGRKKIKFEKVVVDKRITREFYLFHTDTLWKKIKRNASPAAFIDMISRKIKK